MNWKTKGFTLAEVLITLMIVGVIAAMTLPSLMTKYKQIELEVRFKKTYTILIQALKITMQELGIENSEDFSIYYDKDSNILKQNFVEINKIWESKFSGATKVSKENIKKNNTIIHDFWGELWPYWQTYPVNGTIPNDTYLILPNGAQISYLGYDGNVKYQSSIALVIFFDTNGPYKGPNRIGYDMFYYYGDGKLHTSHLEPACAPLESAINPYWQGIRHSTCSIYAMKNTNPYNSSMKYWNSLYKPKTWWEKIKVQ